MTKYEERLYEIKFFEFVNTFCKNSSAPTRIYDFMELLSALLGTDYLMLRSATKRCILNEYRIRPTKDEIPVLYSKMDYGIRPLCRKLGINTGSYYYIMKKYNEGNINIEPRYPDKERKAIVDTMKGLTKLLNILD